MATVSKKWIGTLPDRCQLCNGSVCDLRLDGFIDGKTVHGPWAIMGPACFRIYGTGLGTGRGQRYDRDGVKVEG